MPDTTSNGFRFQVLRAGLLLGLHVRIDGGRKYETEEIKSRTDGATETAEWRTLRTIFDADEYKRAQGVASDVAGTIRKCCVQTDFGPMCPAERLDDLWAATAEARATAEEFNRTARYSTIRATMLPAMVGELDPASAARAAAEAEYAVAGEIRSLLESMQRGIEAADPAKIRDAASKARLLGTMLDEKNAARVTDAIAAARKVARDIVRRVEKQGELASTVLADLKGETSAVEAARFAYLDLEESLAPAGVALPSVDVQRFADIAPEAPAGEAPAPIAAAPAPEPAPVAPPAAPALDVDIDDMFDFEETPAPEPVSSVNVPEYDFNGEV